MKLQKTRATRPWWTRLCGNVSTSARLHDCPSTGLAGCEMGAGRPIHFIWPRCTATWHMHHSGESRRFSSVWAWRGLLGVAFSFCRVAPVRHLLLRGLCAAPLCRNMEAARRRELLDSMAVAMGHLVGPGNFFDASQRRTLAEAAVSAWSSECSQCKRVHKLRPSNLFDAAPYVAHKDFLVLFAHTAANLQQLVSAGWHAKMCLRMRTTFPQLAELGPLDVFSAFAELTIVASWATGVAAFYAAMEQPMPAWPVHGGAAGEPLVMRRVSSFAATLRNNAATGFSPFIAELVPDQQYDELFVSMVRYGEMAPYAQVLLSPVDAVAWTRWWSLAYIPSDTVTQFFTKTPSSRTLCRAQLETVAAGLACALQCAF